MHFYYAYIYHACFLLSLNFNKLLIFKKDNEVCGAHVRDKFTNEEWDIKAKCVVNATGPFTDSIRKMDNNNSKSICQPASGVHVVLPDYYW